MHLENPDPTGVFDAVWRAAKPRNGHITSAAVTAALKQTGLENGLVRMVWRQAKIVGQPPMDQMNHAEWVKVCQLAIEAGADPLSFDAANTWADLGIADDCSGDDDEDGEDVHVDIRIFEGALKPTPPQLHPINPPLILYDDPLHSNPMLNMSPLPSHPPLDCPNPTEHQSNSHSDDSDDLVEDDPLEAEEHENARERLRLQRRASSGPTCIAPLPAGSTSQKNFLSLSASSSSPRRATIREF